MKHIDDKSVMDIQVILSETENSNSYIDLAQSSIYRFHNVIEDAITKLLAVAYYTEFNINLFKTDIDIMIEFITFALAFVCIKLSFVIRGPCALGYDFFLTGGGYIKNSHFLFGIPSQFRI